MVKIVPGTSVNVKILSDIGLSLDAANSEILFSTKSVVLSPMPMTLLKRKVVDEKGVERFENETYWEKELRNLKIEIQGSREYGIPYGTDILVILWLMFEARRQSSPMLKLKNYDSFFKLYGIKKEGKSYKRLVEKLQRILRATFFYNVKVYKDGIGYVDIERFQMIEKSRLKIMEKNKKGNLKIGDQYILLTDKFYKSIINSKIPYNLNTIRKLKHSSYDLFLYFYLNYRSYIVLDKMDGRATMNLWGETGLYEMMGTNLSRRHFKVRIKKSLERIKKEWVDCPVNMSDSKDQLIIDIKDFYQLDVKIDKLKYSGKKIRNAPVNLSEKQKDIIQRYAPIAIQDEFRNMGYTEKVKKWFASNIQEYRKKRAASEKAKKPEELDMENEIRELWEEIRILKSKKKITKEDIGKISMLRNKIRFINNGLIELKRSKINI